MKTLIPFLCILLGAAFLLPSPARAAEQPQVAAEAAILMDADTGAVLYEKNIHEKLYPASITKLMTVLLGIEAGQPDKEITMTAEAVAQVPRDTTHIALTDGEVVRMQDMLYATMMASANDAANAVALGVSGSLDAFAEKMNRRMAQIGATGTHFANANGLPDENHYTTAYDMALLTREGLKNETFREIFGRVTYSMDATNKNSSPRAFATLCLLLKNNENNARYEAAIGGKTGWTVPAQYTMVSAAEKDGQTLIAVVLKCPLGMDRYTDTIALFDYGFDNFRNVAVPDTVFEPVTIPIISGNVIVQNAVVSLPENLQISTDLDFQADTIYASSSLPSYFEQAPADLTLQLSAKTASGETVEVGTVLLNVEILDLDVPVANPFGTPGGSADKTLGVGGILGIIFLVLLGIVIFLAVFFIATNMMRIRRNRRLREQRLLRKRQEENTTQSDFILK